jgi:acetate kinase
MTILALNSGSSSLKAALVGTAEEAPKPASALVQRVGTRQATARLAIGDEPAHDEPVSAGDHAAAVELIVGWLASHDLIDGVAAVGHRIVHGGPDFTSPTLVDDAVLARLEELRALAPLHNGPALRALRAAQAVLGPHVPHVATFDTAFHAAMPAHAARYAIDPELADRHGVRRYGFHGLAHRSMLERYSAHAGRAVRDLRLVTLQLGNGCSAAAVRGGRSLDTTMGLTPLEGLMMGTRSGDVDPALVGFLARREGVEVDEIEHRLNHSSGLLGVSGRSRDMRDLLEAEDAGDPRAALAVEMFCYRVRKAIGASLAALGGADAIVFGGGIGLHAAAVRLRACAGLEWCGVTIDRRRNAVGGREGRISAEGAPIEVFAADVDEERVIAGDAWSLVSESPAGEPAGAGR